MDGARSFTTGYVVILTYFQCAVIALDYKLNFTPDTSDAIPALHERVADRIYYLLTTNGGLYIKIGAW
jgi:aarF domain-containing kinase